MAFRVPMPDLSMSEIVAENRAQADAHMKVILVYTVEDAVSTDLESGRQHELSTFHRASRSTTICEAGLLVRQRVELCQPSRGAHNFDWLLDCCQERCR